MMAILGTTAGVLPQLKRKILNRKGRKARKETQDV